MSITEPQNQSLPSHDECEQLVHDLRNSVACLKMGLSMLESAWQAAAKKDFEKTHAAMKRELEKLKTLVTQAEQALGQVCGSPGH